MSAAIDPLGLDAATTADLVARRDVIAGAAAMMATQVSKAEAALATARETCCTGCDGARVAALEQMLATARDGKAKVDTNLAALEAETAARASGG